MYYLVQTKPTRKGH